MLLDRTPIVQCSGWTSKTIVGPAPHFPWPSVGAVAVGSKKVGPMPQTSLPGWAGDRKNDGFKSPRPLAPPWGAESLSRKSHNTVVVKPLVRHAEPRSG